jgi:hypothetical protein
MGKKMLIDLTARGRNGGKARARNMDAAERSEAARKAVTKRWDEVRAKKALAEERKPRKSKVPAHED